MRVHSKTLCIAAASVFALSFGVAGCAGADGTSHDGTSQDEALNSEVATQTEDSTSEASSTTRRMAFAIRPDLRSCNDPLKDNCGGFWVRPLNTFGDDGEPTKELYVIGSDFDASGFTTYQRNSYLAALRRGESSIVI